MSDNVGFNAGLIEALHEHEEGERERAYERDSNRFYRAINNPVIRYKADPPALAVWTVDDAARVTKAFEAALTGVQVVFDESLTNDYDWQITGVAEPALRIIEKLCEDVICSDMDADGAKNLIENYIGDM